ncbi:MAG: hypothetical protein WA183_20025 [Chthoniobacterales bacterium]
MKSLKLVSIFAVLVVSGYAFWSALLSWALAPDVPTCWIGRTGVHVGRQVEKSTASSFHEQSVRAAKLPGVPADTITQATKVARDLREASVAYEQGIVVERNHVTAVALKTRADSIDELIDEIQSQPVTGKPEDAEKKLPSLRALRSIAKLDQR